MKIVKYTRLASGKYKVLFDNKKELILYERVIIDTNLLYKKEITNEDLSNEILNIFNSKVIDDKDPFNKFLGYF